jgi:hypothetical protein
MTEHVELIKVLTALGLSDLARKRADMMVAWTMRLEESQVSLKLYGYGAMAQAAKALGSSQLGSWAAEQALSIPLKDLDFAAAVSMLDVADGLSTLDMSLARRSLARAEQMVDIVSREPSRIVFQLQIAKLWSQFGDVRRARLAARKARSTSSEMEAYTEILDSVLARSQSTIARDLGIGSFKLPMEDDIRSILYPIGSTL